MHGETHVVIQETSAVAPYQDSVVIGVARPAELGALYRDLMSPYCPGLSLASCPSPQADSLRKAIAVRFENGETPAQITEALVVDYGADIRGSPAFEGFGATAFVVPGLLMLVGALLIARWIRRSVKRNSVTALLLVLLPLVGCNGGRDLASTANDSEAGKLSASAGAETERRLPQDSVWLGNAWMRAGAAGATTGAYAVIYNTRSDSVNVIGATSDVADTVEVHESMNHDGMVHMEPQRSLTIPAGDSVVLAPGGKHFMVRVLQRTLTAGEVVDVRILLSNGAVVNVPFAVRPIGG